MRLKSLLFICLAAGSQFDSAAQETQIYTHDLAEFKSAERLYKAKQYQASQNAFTKISNNLENEQVQSDCAYYIANCAVRLNQQNADVLVENFVKKYPTSTKRNSAFLNVADYYFTNGKYSHAQKWYAKVDKRSLTKNQKEKFNFYNGYTAFSVKDYKKAKSYLSKVESSKKYGSQAKYYLGYMAYDGDDYKGATTYFDQVSGSSKYKQKLSYYQADLNFKLGNFEKAIELATAQLEKSNRNEQSELNKIIGESYFNLKNYRAALPYLTAYKGRKGKWSNTDYYQLGYTYYKQGKYTEAIAEFNKIISADNSVAQNAYYHLAECYLKADKKTEALNAFRNASEMEYSETIQEDAYFNYVKLSYQIGNAYKSVPELLTSYLNKYPKSANRLEVEALLIDSYISSKNYKEALVLLDGKNDFKSKKAFQKVAFYRGLELYNENNYQGAKQLFQSAINEPQTPIFTARAIFWNAEADYNLSEYEEALIGFKQFLTFDESANTPEAISINYNIAYTYFKKKDYTNSGIYFSNYISSKPENKSRLNDAYLRLADGYFVSSNYNEAITNYNKAIKVGTQEKDYAVFQKAMSYGFLGKDSKKQKTLESFIKSYPTSNLQDDALYTLANVYVKQNAIAKGMTKYEALVTKHPKSPLVSKSLLRQGLSYYNNNNNAKALSKLKIIAKNYPGTPEATQAVATARLIYIDTGEVNKYAAWVKTLDFVEVTDIELDNATYLSGEKQFLDGNDKQAIKQFNIYLNQFKEGAHALNAHFYLAQLYFKQDLKETAQPHFDYVIAQPHSEFTEEALLRLAQIHLEAKDWTNALPVLNRLQEESNFSQNVLFAQSNSMKAYYQLEDYTNAVIYAEKVLSKETIDDSIKNDAKVIIARSAIKNNNEVKAEEAYAKVEASATGVIAAEALYYKAYFLNKKSKFEASNVIVQEYIKDYSSYRYYGAKAFVLMGKNFYYQAEKDAFQATYILESVIKNFAEYDDVVTEAKETLAIIKTEEAKTNSSVQEED